MESDPRIAKLIGDMPKESITMDLKTPKGNKYLLVDNNADGVLDFVKKAGSKTTMKIDVKLLDSLQKKYTWIIGVIKKHYQK